MAKVWRSMCGCIRAVETPSVQRMLGHASAAMTLDVYAGLFGDDLDAVADRLDEAAALARADCLRTQGGSADVLPLDLGTSAL